MSFLLFYNSMYLTDYLNQQVTFPYSFVRKDSRGLS